MAVTVASVEPTQFDALEAQRAKFEEDGMLVIENAIPRETIDRVREATDRIVREAGPRGRWIGKPVSAKRRVSWTCLRRPRSLRRSSRCSARTST
jgi:hypothetical protein